MQVRFFFIVFLWALASPLFTNAQADSSQKKFEVRGKITDELTNESIFGATVMYENGKGVETDTSGSFVLLLPNGTYNLKINYVGYKGSSQKIIVKGRDLKLDPVVLVNTNVLNEVEVAADVAKVQETPVALSNVSARQILEELGANDLPSLLNTTPGAYSSQQGGGFGDSRVNIRGFDQRNVAVLVDGVPVNDMENGQVYWSNWAGLSEVTKKMQVQRGLGASRLALPSVGGVMNIITTPVEQKRFFIIKNDMGTANFQRISGSYNSGMIKNKVGVTLSGSYNSGDGYVDGTWFKAWSYFAKITYKINNRSLLTFGANGAPQVHGQRSFAINMAYQDEAFARKQGINVDSVYAAGGNKYSNQYIRSRGITYSPDWGYVNGQVKTVKQNYFHKPLFNLSYFNNIGPKLSFSNVLYVSIGNGGGTSLLSFPIYDKAYSGQLLLQDIYNVNILTKAGTLVPGQSVASNYIYASVNQHKWVGTLASLKYQASKKLDFLGGFDARYYSGTHYQTPYDLLGGNYVLANDRYDANQKPIKFDSLTYLKRPGDKINYYYQSKVTWLGLFGQLEYKSDKITAFVTFTGNQTTLQSVNYFAKKDFVFDKGNVVHGAIGYGDTLYYDGTTYGVRTNPYSLGGINPITNNADGSISFYDILSSKNVTINPGYSTFDISSSKARTNTTPLKTYYGYTAKGGFNYKLNYNNNVFVNAGYMSVAPRFSNVFDRSGIELKNIKNQLITSADIGYGYKDYTFAANINAYITNWKNKPLDFGFSVADPDKPGALIYYNIPGVDAILKGMEFDFSAKINRYIKLEGFGMIADWRWNSGGNVYIFSNEGKLADSLFFDATNVHLGNAPQRQLGGNVRFEYKGFYVKPQFVYFDKMYSQFDPTALKVVKTGTVVNDYRGVDSWRMPGFGLVNLFAGYTMYAKNNTRLDIVASMNNVLNTVYMTDATFTSATKPNNYNATNSNGWLGLGRRVNVGVKLTL